MKRTNLLLAAIAAAGMTATTSALADQHMKEQKQRVVVGEITDMKDVTLKGIDSSHKIVKIENDTGKTMYINLGAMDTPPQDLKMEKGDRLLVIGKNARINGKPVLHAQYVGELFGVGRMGKSQ